MGEGWGERVQIPISPIDISNKTNKLIFTEVYNSKQLREKSLSKHDLSLCCISDSFCIYRVLTQEQLQACLSMQDALGRRR